MGFLRHRAGDRIKNRYEVLDHLGGGNFGSVYRVRDAAVGNVLACKEMHVLNDPSTSGDERAAAVDLFKREALNLATLRHPNIPAAYFDQEEGDWHVCPLCGLDFEDAAFCPVHGAPLLSVHERYYLMMDFIDGQTLEEMALEQARINGQPLAQGQCIEWTAQIGSALRSLHMVGIVHRDVKPDNIKIRTQDNAAVLLDFGLTKKAEEAGGYGTLRLTGTGRFGTPGYAPSSVEEQEHPEARSDIYALGMTLYRLLSNRDPQEQHQLEELLAHPATYFNKGLSPELDRIIAQAIAADKSKRYQTIDDMLADLSELREGQPNVRHAPPFIYSNGARARSLGDLARLVEALPEESVFYLFNGMFTHWLRQNGFMAPARTAEHVVNKFADKAARALEIFRRSLSPAATPGLLPRLAVEPATLSFGSIESGAVAARKLRIRNSGRGLAWGRIEVAEETAGSGAADDTKLEVALPGLAFPYEFEGNDIEVEFKLDTSQVSIGAYAGVVLLETDGGAVRVPVDYTVQPLELRVEPPELNFGSVLAGRRATQSIRVLRTNEHKSAGAPRGRPRGTLYAGESMGGLVVPERFTGEEPIEITVDGAMPDAIAKSYEGLLQLDTNGGRLRVPVRYAFVLPPERWVSLILGTMALFAICSVCFRLLYYAVNPEYGRQWLWQPGGATAAFQFKSLGPIAVGSIVGLLVALRIPVRTQDKAMWGQIIPVAGVLLGAGASWGLVWLLHWTAWALGDWLLRATLGDAPPRAWLMPPVLWGLAGAAVGGLWGVARAFSAIGKFWMRYLVWAVFFFVFLGLLINAMLATV